jgi:N-acetylmuramoyl-L-alanine amidase
MQLRVGLFLSLVIVCLAAVPAAARPVLIEVRVADGAPLGRLVGEREDRITQVPLADVARLLGTSLETRGDRAGLVVKGKRLEVRRDRPRVLVAGRRVDLSAPVRVRHGVWLAPSDFLVRALPPLLGKPVGVTTGPVPLVAASAPVRPVVAVSAPASRTAVVPGPPPTAPEAPRPEPAAVASAPPAETPSAGAGGAIKAGALELRYRSYPAYTRVVLEGDARFEPRLVETPGGLVVPLVGLRTAAPRGVRAVRDGLVATVEIGDVRGVTTLRVSFERPPAARKVYRLQDPPRLILEFYRGTPAATPVPASRPSGPETVVIDPGHGGHDPGATGARGLQEKELTLDVANRLAAILQAEHGVKAILTRSRDTFLTLRERTAFANRQRADLFVSIHVNAARGATASGTETYFLSSEATDNAARAAAAFENRVIEIESGPRTATRDVLRSILWDLTQSEFQQASSRLAEQLQDSLERALRLPNRGVKQAPFYVLGGAAMPAVLVEIGFISNPQEEERLTDEGYRDRIARALSAGVAAYKQRSAPRAGTVARR